MLDVLIVIAADIEWQIARRILLIDSQSELAPGQSATLMSWPGTVILRSGWGKVAAAASTQRAIDIHHPDLVICLGTCGGIFGRVQLGDLVIIRRALMHDLRPLIGDVEAEHIHYISTADPVLLSHIADFANLTPVTIGTGDRDLDENEARSIAEQLQVDVVDWEAAAIAFVARQNDVPWVILKGVSDMVTSSDDAIDLHRSYAEGAEQVMTGLIEILGSLFERLPLPGWRR